VKSDVNSHGARRQPGLHTLMTSAVGEVDLVLEMPDES
ncbi:unnamed protein product, partial [Acidithrix sp. C25]